MNETRERVAANVVTYNRKFLLGECLDALLNQTYPLDAVFIIDNASTDGTPEYLMERGFIDALLHPRKEPLEAVKRIPLSLHPDRRIEIHYVRMHENTGSSGGQYEGVKRGYEQGFDRLWLMDDDAEATNDCLEILIREASKNGFWAVCPLIVGSPSEKVQFNHHKILRRSIFLNEEKIDTWEDILKKGVVRIDANAFVGPLIHREVISSVGFPNKDFFMWVDDKEFTYRISRRYDLYLVTGGVIKHKDENNPTEEKRIPTKIYWKQYYGIRNGIVFESVFNNRVTAVLKGLYVLFRKSLGVMYFREDNKLYRLKVIFRGVVDGLMGRLGRNDGVC